MWPELVQDGYCNDESNNPDCNFDGDDCCYACVDKEHCQDCLCVHEHGWEGINPLIGDGYCQDGMNSAQCNFDGGDCCGSCINTDYCTNCSCLGIVENILALVSCGVHYAGSCSECPQENDVSWCSGDCKWENGECIESNFGCIHVRSDLFSEFWSDDSF